MNNKKNELFAVLDYVHSKYTKPHDELKTILNECEGTITTIKNVYSEFEASATPDTCNKLCKYNAPDITNIKQKLSIVKNSISEVYCHIKTNSEIVKKLEAAESSIFNTKAHEDFAQEVKTHIYNDINISDWICDKKYCPPCIIMTEDCLTLKNPTSAGHPATIGDLPFNKSILSYDIIAPGLVSSDGFGIIEFEKFKEIFSKNSNNPVAYNDFIGITFELGVKNMTIERGGKLLANEKYNVVADFTKLVVTIQGKDCLLTAKLKPGVFYVPCFSCGFKESHLIIKPL